MNFAFHLSAAAANNSPNAQHRESQRMGCLALGMSFIGHDVAIVDAAPAFRDSPRWRPFAHLYKPGTTGIEVWPAEALKGREHIVDVAFKCSVGTQNDHLYLSRCRVLVAHEYNQHFSDHASLLPVPFMVHDSVMDVFLADGLFEAFVRNDIASIRDRYSLPKDKLLGTRACMHHHRRRFIDTAPTWADVSLYTHQPTGGFEPREHLRWITQFRGGLCLPGTSPKTNLPSLLALMGVAIVSPPFPHTCRDTPPITKRNAIIFESWDQVKSELEDDSRLVDVVAQATSDYTNCWSAMGQGRLIAEKFS